MIEGVFRDDAPYVTLTVNAERGNIRLDFIVDTGFSGALALPRAVLQQIGAESMGSDIHRLADNTFRRFPVFAVTVEEDEEQRILQVLEKDGDPLLGTLFLREQNLNIEVTDGGQVTIEPF